MDLTLRLSTNYAARSSEDIIIDFAKDGLGYQRVHAGMVRALRYMLGSQYYAERIGSKLQMSRDKNGSDLAMGSEKTTRGLIDRFVLAGYARKKKVITAPGHANEVAFFKGEPVCLGDRASEYERLQRSQEDEDFLRMSHRRCPVPNPVVMGLTEEEVPY